MQSKKHRVPDAALNIRRARWGRRGVIASLLVGMGTLAAKSFSWLHFSPADGGEYRVIAQWQVSTGGEGLRDLGKRLQERFHGVDNAAVMIFDDANAARAVRRGSRIVSETDFQAALIHQRAMYLKSAVRSENIFTIYKSYPVVGEVIRFEEDDLRTTSR